LSILIKDLFVKNQFPPIYIPWKEISHLTDLSHNNLDELLDNTDASKEPQQNDVGVSNSESSDQKNSKELPNSLNPAKQQRKQVALSRSLFTRLKNTALQWFTSVICRNAEVW
jgi:hypothetical protein